MSSTRKLPPLSRRALLRGVGGVAVGLPFLEIMIGRDRKAHAAGEPKRFCMMFAGALSAGSESGGNHFVPMAQHKGGTPLPEGPDYPLTIGLGALGKHGVKPDVAIVSGLLTPSGGEPGVARWNGADVDWHSGACYCQIVGATHSGDVGGGNFAKAEGPDQILGRLLEPGGATSRILNLGVQPVPYSESNASYGTFSFKKSGSGFVKVANVTDPAIVWDMLFKSAPAPSMPPTGTPPPKTADSFASSILDLVKADATRLRTRVGKADQIRLEQHFDEINDLQKKIQPSGGGEVPGMMSGSGCQAPPNPAGTYAAARSMGRYSGEFERGRILSDLIHMAFVCDKSRVASMIISNTQSQMDADKLVPIPATDLHESNHGDATPEDHAKLINWHVDHFAYLAAKMKATPEGAGTLLDNVGMIMFFEGGEGRHFDGSKRTFYGSHQSEDVVILVAGHAGGLKVGQHYQEKGKNPASVTLTVMRALGHTGALNEVSETIPRLLG